MTELKLFELMVEKGITYTALSKETGISVGNISDWKSGKSSPSVAALVKIADYFNVSLDCLAGRSTIRYCPHCGALWCERGGTK